jgi:hypothetical protein
MSFYPGLASTATRLLTQKGQSVTLRRQTAGAYDPATGSAAVTVTNFTGIQAAVFGFKNMEIDGTMILKGDKKVLMAVGVKPTKDDVVSIGGIDHAVLDVQEVSPAGVDVLYKLQCRRT